MSDYIKRINYKNYIIKILKNDPSTTNKKGKYRASGFINGSIKKEVAFNSPSYNEYGDDIGQLIETIKSIIDSDWKPVKS